MKKLRFLSALLCVAMIFCLLQPVAYAAEEVGNVTTSISDEYAVYSFENDEKLYNVIVLREIGQVQFAMTRQSEPDICYEYAFDLPANLSVESETFWDSILDICFDNENNWRQITISEAVQVADNTSSGITTFATDSNIAYFEDWLADQNGKELYYFLYSTKEVDGILFSWYQTRTHSAYLSYSYTIKKTMNIASFITGIIGIATGTSLFKGIYNAIKVAVNGAEVVAGSAIKEYTLRTISCFHFGANGGTYPYSMADKHIFYTGYVYSKTGMSSIDTSSKRIVYDPSEEYYLSYTQQLNDAYEEYLDIGDQG